MADAARGIPVARSRGELILEVNPWEMYMTPDPARHDDDDVLHRVQGEFLEMPGLRLSEPQARRLWGLDAEQCAALLGTLVDAKFLVRTRDGAFMMTEHATLSVLRPRARIPAA